MGYLTPWHWCCAYYLGRATTRLRSPLGSMLITLTLACSSRPSLSLPPPDAEPAPDASECRRCRDWCGEEDSRQKVTWCSYRCAWVCSEEDE
jgi:hypothetical protein